MYTVDKMQLKLLQQYKNICPRKNVYAIMLYKGIGPYRR